MLCGPCGRTPAPVQAWLVEPVVFERALAQNTARERVMRWLGATLLVVGLLGLAAILVFARDVAGNTYSGVNVMILDGIIFLFIARNVPRRLRVAAGVLGVEWAAGSWTLVPLRDIAAVRASVSGDYLASNAPTCSDLTADDAVDAEGRPAKRAACCAGSRFRNESASICSGSCLAGRRPVREDLTLEFAHGYELFGCLAGSGSNSAWTRPQTAGCLRFFAPKGLILTPAIPTAEPLRIEDVAAELRALLPGARGGMTATVAAGGKEAAAPLL